MIYPNFSAYVGRETDLKYVGFLAEHNFFFVLETPISGYTKDQGKQFMQDISQALFEKDPKTLNEFVEFVTSMAQKGNLPLSFSIAAGYCKNMVLYLKTIGDAQIYLKRDKAFEKIISGTITASGHVKEGDIVVFSTSFFMEELKGREITGKILNHKKVPNELVEQVGAHMKDTDDSGAIALFVSFHEKIIERGIEEVENKNNVLLASVEGSVQEKEQMVPAQPQRINVRAIVDLLKKKKKIALIAGAVVLLLFFLNSFHLFDQKKKTSFEAKKESVTREINDKLQKATSPDEKTPEAVQLIGQAKTLLAQLKEEGKSVKDAEKDLDDLQNKINQTENTVLKKEVKTGVEFYNLALDEKEARGDRISLFENVSFILNKTGKAYTFSLDKKSLIRKIAPEFVNADIITGYSGKIYVYKQGAGVYELQDKAVKRVVESDKEWGNIVDMQVYNGNIYLLDVGKGSIYKYSVTDSGFSGKVSYFKSATIPGLESATSFAIDAAVYVAADSNVYKYLSGSREDFSLQLPSEGIRITKILTGKDVEHIYLWSKEEGAIYLFTKEGVYEKQILSESLKKGSDIVIYNNAAYILTGNKIYSISF